MPIINPFPLPNYVWGPTLSVQPFTYKDGASYLQILERLRGYVTKVLVPAIELEIGNFEDATETNMTILTEYVNNAIQQIINNSVELQDAVVAELIDTDSLTKTALDARYANKATQTTVETGRLSAENVSSAISSAVNEAVSDEAAEREQADTAIQTSITNEVDARTNADTAIQTSITNEVDARTNADAALSSRITDTENEIDGRLAPTNLTSQMLAVDRGNPFDVGLFTKLRNSVAGSGSCKVLFVGDSHASGGYSTFVEQDVVQRLAYRAGATSVVALNTISSTPAVSGMNFYNGAVGGTKSDNYLNSGLYANIANLKPDYVFHVIGSNDAAVGTSIATFKSNLQAAISTIKSGSPSAINVLVHVMHPGYFTPTIPWTAYGNAMQEIADADPNNVAYIDAELGFTLLGMQSSRTGLFNSDSSHLNSVGQKYLADIIGKPIGIPSETGFDTAMWYNFNIIAGTYSNGAFITNVIEILHASYPRLMTIHSSFFLSGVGTNTEISIQRKLNDNLDHIYRTAKTGESHINATTTFYMSPNKNYRFLAGITPNGTVGVSALADYNFMHGVVTAL